MEFLKGYFFRAAISAALLVIGILLVLQKTRPAASKTTVIGLCWRYLIEHHGRRVFHWSRRIYGRTGSPRVYRLSKTRALKLCWDCQYEPATMEFVRKSTNIPVPKVHDIWLHGDGRLAFIMDWIEGKTLKSVWPTLNNEGKRRISDQLKGYIDELRSLRQAEGAVWIGPQEKQPFSDSLLSSTPCGPFSSDQEFNNFLIDRFEFLKETEAGQAQLKDLTREVLRTPPRRIVFTHSDIMPRNILVNDDNDIVAILDWEVAGWMPEQWEYLKAMWMGQYDGGWPAFVHLILEPYDDDLRLHNMMREMQGSPF